MLSAYLVVVPLFKIQDIKRMLAAKLAVHLKVWLNNTFHWSNYDNKKMDI